MTPNSLLVQWAEGFLTVDDSAAIAAADGRVRRQLLALADVTQADAARAIGEAELARLRGSDRPIVAEPVAEVGTDAAPYAGWFVGDRLPVTQWDGTGTESVEVAGITVTEDDDGEVRVVPELVAALESAGERATTRLRRIAPGVASDAASVARRSSRKHTTGPLGTEELTWGLPEVDAIESPVLRFRQRCRTSLLDITLLTPGLTATALQVLMNGDPLWMSQNNVADNTYALIPANVYHVVCLMNGYVATEMDAITFNVTTAGVGAQNLSVQLLGAVADA